MATPTNPRRVKSAPVDTSLLSDEQIAKLKKQAADEVEKERQAEQMRVFLASEKSRLQRQEDPDEELIECTLDLPRFADMIRLDDRYYFHGGTYTFTLREYNCVREQVYRMWGHQEEIEGHGREYRRERQIALRGGDQGHSARVLARRAG
jgi:hypothetical protein